MRAIWGVLTALAVAVAGCAETGQMAGQMTGQMATPAGVAPSHEDIRIEEDRYQIRVIGSAATPRAKLEQRLLYRAAEVTLETGHSWFRILGRAGPGLPASLRALEGRIGAPSALPAEAQAGVERSRAGKARAGGTAGHRGTHRGRGAYRRHGRYARPKGYRHHGYARHRGYRHKRYHSGGVRVGVSVFAPFGYYYGPAYGVYGPPVVYGAPYAYVPRGVVALPAGEVEVFAEIQVFEGQKPAGEATAYDAAEVIANLRQVVLTP